MKEQSYKNAFHKNLNFFCFDAQVFFLGLYKCISDMAKTSYSGFRMTVSKNILL